MSFIKSVGIELVMIRLVSSTTKEINLDLLLLSLVLVFTRHITVQHLAKNSEKQHNIFLK
jgi:hypothetical protein